MTTQHTQGRLHVAGQDKVQIRSDKHQIAKAWSFAGKTGQENARRLVAAWNYAEMLGMSTEELELAEQPLCSRRQHEAIQKLRKALDYYVTQDGIAEDHGEGIGGVALFNAEQALKDTEEFK